MSDVLRPGMTVAAAPAQPARDRAERLALRYSAVMMAMCILGQRFGLQLGTSAVSVVGPLGLALSAWCLATGTLAFSKVRLAVYFALTGLLLVETGLHAAAPGSAGVNLSSLAQFLVLTSFTVFTFKAPVAEAAFFRVVTFALLLVALAGIVQFFAQFVGLPLFAFKGVLPDAVLIETGWNLSIKVGVGSLLKANGFFLVEPSVFSQFMALGLIAEVMTTRRAWFILAFIAGLLLSFSGTGWIVLGAFLVGSVLGRGWRGLLLATAVVAALASVVGLAWVAAPKFVAAAASRISEINTPGTSGHLRFITPFWMTHDVFAANPMAWLIGIGSGLSERLTLTYDYNVNTPIKVLVEYGLPALVLYLLLFTLGGKSPVQKAIAFPAIVLVMFAGGYQQFPPVLFLVLLLLGTARLRSSADRRVTAFRRPAAAPAPQAEAAG